jgi:hypothetical protein
MSQEEDNEIRKVGPYQRLQAILSDGKSSKDLKLTDKANGILNELLGEEQEKESFWTKVKNFFSKIDSKIFSKNQKVSNRYQKRN